MSWCTELDRDIYVGLDEVRPRPVARAPKGVCAQALGSALARPIAVLARQVATPNYEMLRFVRLARRNGFHPLVIEHRADRFTVHNPTKRALATLPIVLGRSRNGQPILRRQKILDPAACEGRRLEEIETATGEGLIAYHHRKLLQVLGPEAPRVIDMGQVVATQAAGPAAYYREFFKMLTGGLVLLEDFVADSQTAAFFESTVLPAYRQAVEETGRRPQIARLVPGRRTSSPLWIAYPPATADDPSWLRPAREGLRAAA
ncbi:hypothetical protein [Rubellimicrobium aerolatum]|uniref:Uncharacterized protein n=1 Tax=Rubellimicrobium aerolatum TaxID=490979 RepID=A0ABW0SAB0_9RHOB|nr:hypothetical protein [Rubellimicrobium aerolatum]MBP1805228.1 hypothetical protein [Rubellimicrobium aerolatum]